MSTVLMDEMRQLSASEKLELAKWLIEDAQDELREASVLPPLTQEKLARAIARGLENPRSGVTVEELFASLDQSAAQPR